MFLGLCPQQELQAKTVPRELTWALPRKPEFHSEESTP